MVTFTRTTEAQAVISGARRVTRCGAIESEYDDRRLIPLSIKWSELSPDFRMSRTGETSDAVRV